MRMKRLVHILGFLTFYLNVLGQTHQEGLTYGYFTPGAYSSFEDAFSFTANPASLGGISHLLCGAFVENKWMLKELNNFLLASSFGLGGGGGGIVLEKNGDANFNEQSLMIAYGKHLGKIDIGCEFEYQRDQAAGYGPIHFISSGFGMRFRINEKLTTGWELGLPVSVMGAKMNPERSPQFFRMGFGYSLINDVVITLQIDKQSGQPAEISGNLEYHYGDHFIFLIGINSVSGSVFFKTGWKKNGLGIQLCLLFEPQLGFSPALAMLWENQNRKE